jgi:hypothetical protein
MRIRPLLTAGALAAGLSVAGFAALAGAASAHNLTGGSSEIICQGRSVAVFWSFVSADANGHTIQTVTYDRPVDSSTHTADTITAHTHEEPGSTVSLTATAVFEDGFQSSHTVTTTIPTDVCPAPTTTSRPPILGTVVPTTPPTVPPAAPTTPPTVPATPPAVTAPAVTAPPDTAPPAPSAPTVAPRAVATVPARALPATGTKTNVLLAIGLAIVFVSIVLMAVAFERDRQDRRRL